MALYFCVLLPPGAPYARQRSHHRHVHPGDGVLLKPLPYREPDRPVALQEQTAQATRWGNLWAFAYPNFVDCRRESRSLALAAWRYNGGTITGPGDAEYVDGRQISSGLLAAVRRLARDGPRLPARGGSPLAYVTSQRVPEIGVRMALGATAGDCMRLVLRQSLGMIFAGAAVGIAAAFAAVRVLERLVDGVRSTDPLTFALMLCRPVRGRAVRQLSAGAPRQPHRPGDRPSPGLTPPYLRLKVAPSTTPDRCASKTGRLTPPPR